MQKLFKGNLFVIALALVVVTSASTSARQQKAEDKKLSSYITRATYYSFPRLDGGESEPLASSSSKGRGPNSSSLQSTPLSSFSSPSPGVVVGNTAYEHQSNGSIHRQIQISQHHPDSAIVHFGWMYRRIECCVEVQNRRLRYNAYSGNLGDFSATIDQDFPPVQDTAGYLAGDVIPSIGEYLAVGHHLQNGLLQPRGWWDQGPGMGFWVDSRIPDNVADDPAGTGLHFAWPAAAIQQYGGQTITHILAHETDGEQIKYFRKVGARETGVWTVGLVPDTAENLGYDIYASKTTGKVVLGWLAGVPNSPCDTCSSLPVGYTQVDNDVFVKVSVDGGATWGPKQNVTKCVDGVAGYRAFYDLSVMIDETDNIIAAWPTRQWPSDANSRGSYPASRCRVQFWRESFPPGVIRTVASLEWDATNCNLGAFKMNAGRTQVARCNGKTYVLWEQGNDYEAGIMNDCAERAGVDGSDDPFGAANSDLYVSISEDNGLTWDSPRNITNTRTPGCDSATGVGGPCQSEVYPTLTPFGHNYSGDFTYSGQQVPIAIPGTAGSNNGYFLECQYILDPHAGAAVRGEGPEFTADVMWARIECDTAVKAPLFVGSYTVIDYPALVRHGQFRDSLFRIENFGNRTLSYTVSKYETSGPPGHISFSGFSGSISSGFGNTETGSIRLNAGGIVNTPGTTVVCKGGVVFTSNAPTSPDTVQITYYVDNGIVEPPSWDTIYVTSQSKISNRKGLTVSKAGQFGGVGNGKVNLDFANWNDCDTGATIYLYDGSVVVGYGGADTNMFFNIFQSDWLSETGLRPINGPIRPKVKTCISQNFTLAYSGSFATADSNITMEKVWYAPILSGTGNEDSAWFIQALKVYNTSGATMTQAVIGEAADWDIPSDSGSRNSSSFNPVKNLVYQQGGEFNNVGECQDNNARFGAVRYLGGFKNATVLPNLSGAYVKENSIDIYPTGNFIEKDIFLQMQLTGITVTDSITDLYTVMTFARNQTFATTDTFRFYTAWLTVRNADTTALFTMADRALSWYNAKNIVWLADTNCVHQTCCRVEGDADRNGTLNIVDLTIYVARMFTGFNPWICYLEGDYDDSGSINIVDITKVVTRLFGGGPFAPCP
jgi:hypothetical protein